MNTKKSLPLSEIAEVVMGQSPSGDMCNYAGDGVPLLNGPTEFGLHNPIPVQYTTDVKKLAKVGDLLFCVRGSTTGRMNWADQSYGIGRGLAAIRGKAGYPTSYVKAVIEYRLAELLTIATGSTFPNVSRDMIGAIKAPPISPNHAVQIASVLETFDESILLLRQSNATLEAIAQALFKSWFVDFDPVRAKAEGREPKGVPPEVAGLFPCEFVDSEIGEIPKGWKASTLHDVSDIGIGKTPPRKEPHWFSESPDDVRWVSIRDMGGCGTYISSTSEYLTEKAVERFNVRRVPENTVLLSFKMTIGRVAITDGGMTTNEAIAHCRLSSDSPLASEFIYLYLKQFNYNTLSSTSSIADAVNSKTIRDIPIIVPDESLVEAFQQIVGVIFQQIRTVQQQAANLSTLRDTLLPRLLSGRVLPNMETPS